MPPQVTTSATKASSKPKVLAPTSQRLGISRIKKFTKKTSTSTSISVPTFPALGVLKTTIQLDANGCVHPPKDYFAQCTNELVEELVMTLCMYVEGFGGDGKGGKEGHF